MMKESFEYSLLESGSAIKRGYSLLVRNMGKSIAIITAIVATLVTFTEIGFYSLGAADVISDALVLLTSSYLIYFSLEDAGEKLAKESEAYKKICAEHEDVKSRILGEDMPQLRNFCEEYKQEELKHRVRGILISGGIGTDEYNELIKNPGGVPKNTRRALRAAQRQRPLDFTATDLLIRGKSSDSPEIKNPEKTKLLKLCVGLIPTTLCTLFTVSVMLSAKESLTFASVIESTLKLASLPVVGLRGYSAGYSYINEEAQFWIETKTRLLRTFLSKNP